MKTPNLFKEKLNSGIITDSMLALSLYAVNKRAKNYRNKESEYRNYRLSCWNCGIYYFDKYGNENAARERKKYFYEQKEVLLSTLEPLEVHIESLSEESNKGLEQDEKQENAWVNVYLYFVVDGYGFHKPIAFDIYERSIEEHISKYSGLPVKKIGTLDTKGKEVKELLSCQFVDKVVDVIKSGNYKRE